MRETIAEEIQLKLEHRRIKDHNQVQITTHIRNS